MERNPTKSNNQNLEILAESLSSPTPTSISSRLSSRQISRSRRSELQKNKVRGSTVELDQEQKVNLATSKMARSPPSPPSASQDPETIAPPISGNANGAEEKVVEENLMHQEEAKEGSQEVDPKKIQEPKSIETTFVEDDPRDWSPRTKWIIVAVLSYGAFIPTAAANIFFPAIADLKRDLNTTDTLIELSVSLYILFQGSFPLLWSPLSEVVGRKKSFIVANAIFVISMIVVSVAPNMAVLIVFRVLGAMGSAANLSIAAGSIADMYIPQERGQVIGIYYSLPTIGPALSPVIGGALTETRQGWRSTFYFIAAAGFVGFVGYCFSRDSFRTERSLAWQAAKARAMEKAKAAELKNGSALEKGRSDGGSEATLHQQDQISLSENNSVQRPATSYPPYIAPSYHGPGVDTLHHVASIEDAVPHDRPRLIHHAATNPEGKQLQDLKDSRLRPSLSRKSSGGKRLNKVVTSGGEEISFKPGLKDVNPLASATAVLRQPHNIVSLMFSSLVFASQYSLSYTASRTFASAPYNYSSIYVGLVLLSLGAGGVAGSIIGGRQSDARLRNKALETGKAAQPEERIRSLSVWIAMCLVPPAFVAYGWTAYFHTSIAGPVISLLLLGTCQFYLYSPTLSYLVDSNQGRSSGAIACNSCSRGLLAFVASEVAGPLQDSIGDGALYTGFAVLLIFAETALIIVSIKGRDWRDPEWRWPKFSEIFDRNRQHGSRWLRQRREESEKNR